MQKYTYIILIILLFGVGVFIGRGSTKGTLDTITDNLQQSESRVSELESTVSGYREKVTELKSINTEEKRINKEQADFINKITEGFDNSRESVKSIESGADRGSEIIKSILKEISNQ